MEKFDIEQILRYLTVGFVMSGLAFVCEPQRVLALTKELGVVGFPFTAFTIGTLTYLTYRATLYNFLINPFKDYLTSLNCRVFLKDEYKVTSSIQAEVLWYTIRDLRLKEAHQSIRVHSAGIHLLYMSAFSFCVAMVYCLADGQQAKTLYLAMGSIILSLSGIITDINVEKQELLLLKSVEPSEVRKIVDRMTNRQCSSTSVTTRELRYFKLFLRIVGSVALLAVFAVLMPYSWMNAVHGWLGMGALPAEPIVGYLARSTSAFYALLGGLAWVVSFDLPRHRRVLCYLGAVTIVFGAMLLVVDLREGMPLWWSIAEGPADMVLGFLIVILSYRKSWQQ